MHRSRGVGSASKKKVEQFANSCLERGCDVFLSTSAFALDTTCPGFTIWSSDMILAREASVW